MRGLLTLVALVLALLGLPGTASAQETGTGTLVFRHDLTSGPVADDELGIVVYPFQDREDGFRRDGILPGGAVEVELPAGEHELGVNSVTGQSDALGFTDFTITAGARTVVSARAVIEEDEGPIIILPATALPGQPVRVTGRGYTPGAELLVVVGDGEGSNDEEVVVDEAGQFVVSVLVPPGARGRTTVRVLDAQHTVLASAPLSLTAGPPPTPAPRGPRVPNRVNTGAGGTAPDPAAGALAGLAALGVLAVAGLALRRTRRATVVVTTLVLALALLSPAALAQDPGEGGDQEPAEPIIILPPSAVPGRPVTVRGDGYEPGATLRVLIGEGEVSDAATATADGDGEFAVDVHVASGLTGPTAPVRVFSADGIQLASARLTLATDAVVTPGPTPSPRTPAPPAAGPTPAPRVPGRVDTGAGGAAAGDAPVAAGLALLAAVSVAAAVSTSGSRDRRPPRTG